VNGKDVNPTKQQLTDWGSEAVWDTGDQAYRAFYKQNRNKRYPIIEDYNIDKLELFLRAFFSMITERFSIQDKLSIKDFEKWFNDNRRLCLQWK
jgi:hypothetical protein